MKQNKNWQKLDKKDLPKLAREIIVSHFNNQPLNHNIKMPGFLKKPCACFVSLHYKDGSLRGCIGTILPTKPSLWQELYSNTLLAAFSDPRFPALKREELNEVYFSVDLLEKPQKKEFSELDPKKLGLIAKTPDGRIGLLLPDIKGIDTKEKQLSICLQKGGISPFEHYQIYAFKTQRFEEKKE